MQAVNRILLALIERMRTGRGQFIDVSMTGGLAAFMTIPRATYNAGGKPMRCANETLTGRYACYNVYQSSDGGWFAVGALEPKYWRAFCIALDCEELCADQFAPEPRQSAVIAHVAERFGSRRGSEWREFWASKDACVTPMLSSAESSIAPAAAPPALGEHTREVLRGLGYDDARIGELAALGAIGC